jgi:hypothetical protein
MVAIIPFLKQKINFGSCYIVDVKLFKKDTSDDKKQTLEIETRGMNGRGMTTTRKSPLLHFYYYFFMD